MTEKDGKVKMIGIGYSGVDIVETAKLMGRIDADFYFLHTDDAVTTELEYENVIRIGQKTTMGLDCGGDVEKGRLAVIENKAEIENIIKNSKRVILVTGLGGGTGSGGIVELAKIAKKLNVLSMAIVTKPFGFEGKKRLEIADKAIEQLQELVDSLAVFDSDKILSSYDSVSVGAAFDILSENLVDKMDSIL